MKPECKIALRKCVLRGTGAIFFGWALVTAVILLLSIYDVKPKTHPMTAAQSIKFPENEQMLDALSAQLERDGAALASKVDPETVGAAAIEPAAGSKK